jgi:hypothetical protein
VWRRLEQNGKVGGGSRWSTAEFYADVHPLRLCIVYFHLIKVRLLSPTWYQPQRDHDLNILHNSH